jgi:hypothetical protein
MNPKQKKDLVDQCYEKLADRFIYTLDLRPEQDCREAAEDLASFIEARDTQRTEAIMGLHRNLDAERSLTLVRGRYPSWQDWNAGYNEALVDACLPDIPKKEAA